MKENKSLLNGRFLTCPRCKNPHSVEQYLKLREIEEYQSETSPIYKCPSCKWIFSLSTYVPQEVFEQLAEFFSQGKNSIKQPNKQHESVETA